MSHLSFYLYFPYRICNNNGQTAVQLANACGFTDLANHLQQLQGKQGKFFVSILRVAKICESFAIKRNKWKVISFIMLVIVPLVCLFLKFLVVLIPTYYFGYVYDLHNFCFSNAKVKQWRFFMEGSLFPSQLVEYRWGEFAFHALLGEKLSDLIFLNFPERRWDLSHLAWKYLF